MSAFEVKKPNPIYSFNTNITKDASIITKQTGDQNDFIINRPESKGLYKQTFIPTYNTTNRTTIDPKILELNARYSSYFKPDHSTNSFNTIQFKQDNVFTEPYIAQKKLTTDTGALGIFTIGNINFPY